MVRTKSVLIFQAGVTVSVKKDTNVTKVIPVLTSTSVTLRKRVPMPKKFVIIYPVRITVLVKRDTVVMTKLPNACRQV
jgi:hypothetical protein